MSERTEAGGEQGHGHTKHEADVSAGRKKASALLRDGRTSAKTKSVAASALAQTKPRKGK
ncbi:hypothetical protein I6I64_11760 [Corynebacterium amycolatum]|uniref:hypothetical protein n=1 Tax=Corynebacterium amycolatum TaxID=43765 RepID=UPI00191CAA8E|nr:hypothetical protein [Corynebacterium amycolatum]QQV01163.1 hypothetical protein I6I64_11760 [Corynebacterium amycolatum]